MVVTGFVISSTESKVYGELIVWDWTSKRSRNNKLLYADSKSCYMYYEKLTAQFNRALNHQTTVVRSKAHIECNILF